MTHVLTIKHNSVVKKKLIFNSSFLIFCLVRLVLVVKPSFVKSRSLLDVEILFKVSSKYNFLEALGAKETTSCMGSQQSLRVFYKCTAKVKFNLFTISWIPEKNNALLNRNFVLSGKSQTGSYKVKPYSKSFFSWASKLCRKYYASKFRPKVQNFFLSVSIFL